MGKSKFIKVVIFGLLISNYVFSSIHDKSRAGLFYNYGFAPKASLIIDSKNKLDLTSLHYAGLQVDVPYNQYLSYGFSLDMMMVKSPNYDYANMGEGQVNSNIMALALSGLVKPQIPITFTNGDLWAFLALEAGLGGTPALTMGAYSLSRKSYSSYSNMPSPFPLLINSALQAGFEYYFSEFVGVQLGAGYRFLWFMHPMITKKNYIPGLAQAKEAFLAYDVSAFFASASIKLAF